MKTIFLRRKIHWIGLIADETLQNRMIEFEDIALETMQNEMQKEENCKTGTEH